MFVSSAQNLRFDHFYCHLTKIFPYFLIDYHLIMPQTKYSLPLLFLFYVLFSWAWLRAPSALSIELNLTSTQIVTFVNYILRKDTFTSIRLSPHHEQSFSAPMTSLRRGRGGRPRILGSILTWDSYSSGSPSPPSSC